MSISTSRSSSRIQTDTTLPARFWVGLILIAVWWPISWLQIRPLSDNYFFPIWLGFILVVDAWVFQRTGTSLMHRSRWMFVILFILSTPVWWLFEGFNLVLDNWQYRTPEDYERLEFALRATLPFSTVIPAVFVASELVQSFGKNPLRILPRLRLETRTQIALHVAGWLMLLAVLLFPRYAFPLVWLSVFFILDPLATFAGGRSIGSYLKRGDWSPVWAVAAGTVICGFFWEMWNFYSLPKWTYSVPYVDFWRIFEMPILGYGGYISFGLELFSFYALVAALISRASWPRVNVGREQPN